MKNLYRDYSIVLLIVLIVFGLIIAFFASSYLAGVSDKYDVNNKNTATEEIVNSKTKITLYRHYKKSDTTLALEDDVPSDFIGLNEEKVKQMYSDWEMISFSKEEIKLKKEIDSYPPGFYKIGFIEVNSNEYVAGFTFDEDGKEILYEKTDFLLEFLDEEAVKKIKDGIYIEGEDAFLSQFENYID